MEKIFSIYEHCKCISLTVIEGRVGKSALRADINHGDEELVPIAEIGNLVVYDVDSEGVMFQSQNGTYDSAMLHFCTQQSNNLQNGRTKRTNNSLQNVQNKRKNSLQTGKGNKRKNNGFQQLCNIKLHLPLLILEHISLFFCLLPNLRFPPEFMEREMPPQRL